MKKYILWSILFIQVIEEITKAGWFEEKTVLRLYQNASSNLSKYLN